MEKKLPSVGAEVKELGGAITKWECDHLLLWCGQAIGFLAWLVGNVWLLLDIKVDIRPHSNPKCSSTKRPTLEKKPLGSEMISFMDLCPDGRFITSISLGLHYCWIIPSKGLKKLLTVPTCENRSLYSR